MAQANPTALISYSHDSSEHERKVLDLCNRLRARGIDACIDQFLAGAPSEGWPLWMERQIAQRDFTLMVCTQSYLRRFMEDEPAGVGRGVVWEARILRNLLYEDSERHGRIIPILFEPDARQYVPIVFRGNFYDVSDERGFESLLRHLLREPGSEIGVLGPLGVQGSRWSAFERPWLVPDAMRTRYFTGRESLLAAIRKQLDAQHRAALSGLGGVGKTQTAIEFAVRHRADYPDGVFWTNAETTSGLTGGFVEIAKVLRLAAAASEDQERLVQATLEWFNGTDRWLLILDNVDDRKEILPFVPQRGKGDILITSRESVFQELGIARGIETTDLDGEEAVAFLLARTGRGESERGAAADLAAELGNLPLALEQAAAYIAETNAAFPDYLAAFRKRRVGLLERAKGLVTHETVATTWSANFAAVEAISSASADVLRVGAFLGADAIPFEIFSEGGPSVGEAIAAVVLEHDELAMGELLRPLVRYSLIRSDPASRSFGVHRLVQDIVRAGMDAADRTRVVERAIGALDVAFPDAGYATWARCDRLVPHVLTLAAWAQTHGVYLEQMARILRKAGDYLNQRGRYDEACSVQQQSLALGERLFGPDHLDVATSLGRLADVYENLGRYQEAANLVERSLSIQERALGPDHPDVAKSLNGLANAYVYLAQYDKAQALYERSAAILERTVGSDSPNLATALSNIASIHIIQGRYAQAQPIFARAQAIQERALGPDDPKVAVSINGLADSHFHLKRFDEALECYERARTIFERALGPDHQYVAYSVEGMANALSYQDRFAEAEPLYERALAIRERALGPEHPQVALSLTALADFYARRERLPEAQSLYERALALRERTLGPDHATVGSTLVGLAALKRRLGRDEEATALYQRALAIKTGALDADHHEIAEIRGALDELRAKTASHEPKPDDRAC